MITAGSMSALRQADASTAARMSELWAKSVTDELRISIITGLIVAAVSGI
jgi:hypothetical protein